MARIGSPEADRVLAICPGAKLEDGLCTSGVSVACLREHLRREIPRRVAMVFVHRIDPLELAAPDRAQAADRSEEHTSELQSLMSTSYAVLCLKKETR